MAYQEKARPVRVQPAGEDEAAFWKQQNEAFALVQAVLDGRAMPAQARLALPPWSGLQRRLIDALDPFLASASSDGAADVAALSAAVLRRQASRPGASEPSLSWAPEVIDRFGSSLVDAGLRQVRMGGRSLLTAERWRPAWLDGDALAAVDAAEPRRLRPRAPEADVFFQESTHYEWYATEGQQIAARCVELSSDGSTILVSLPTGVGKSVVGHFGALKPQAKGTTVVVVPTISLARDQEVHLQHALDRGEVGRPLRHRSFAYLGSTTDAVKDEIRQRVRSGEQGVVFLAPESLLALVPALAEAAYQGRLVDFVVDEVHAVLGWGADFRPDFQTIAGVRRGLLEACPGGFRFRTILLSATITSYAAEVLGRLFGAPSSDGQPEPPRYTTVEGLLRPEPSYYIVDCVDEDERRSRLLSAVFHVPRPAIVYVTRPGAAEELVEAARDVGFTRVATYTGASSAREREVVESGWRDSGSARTHIDVVFATSAFGLGIDQSDVRAVIHAFTPETASRFYQEVGRGGRDGRACLSLLLTTAADVRLCRNLAKRTYPREKVRPRWESMFHHRVAVPGDNRFWVDLDDVRPELRGRGVRPGQKRNRSWNQRVLTLLQDASLIELDTPPSARAPATFRSPVGLRLSRADTYEATWDEAWESARHRGFVDAVADFNTMQNILRRDRCTAEWFADQFAIAVDGRSRRPAVACSGCPWCREHGHSAWADRPWATVSASGAADVDGARLDDLLAVAPRRVLAVVADSAQRPKAVAAALRAATGCGVIFATDTSLRTAAFVDERRGVRPGLADENCSAVWRAIPGTIELIDGIPDGFEDSAFRMDGALLRVLIVPPMAPDPVNPQRSIAEMRSVPVLFADQFLSLLG